MRKLRQVSAVFADDAGFRLFQIVLIVSGAVWVRRWNQVNVMVEASCNPTNFDKRARAG